MDVVEESSGFPIGGQGGSRAAGGQRFNWVLWDLGHVLFVAIPASRGCSRADVPGPVRGKLWLLFVPPRTLPSIR